MCCWYTRVDLLRENGWILVGQKLSDFHIEILVLVLYTLNYTAIGYAQRLCRPIVSARIVKNWPEICNSALKFFVPVRSN